MTPEEAELFSVAARADGLAAFIAVSPDFKALPEAVQQAKRDQLTALRSDLAQRRAAFDARRRRTP